MMNPTIRVGVWSTGRISRSAIRAISANNALELVTVYTHSKDRRGVDAGELSGSGPCGVITGGREQFFAAQPDCALYLRDGFDIEEVAALLNAGINVITTRSEFFDAFTMAPAQKEPLVAACSAGQASLYATGSSPGFSTALLPLVLTNLSSRPTRIIIDEFADIAASTTPSMITDVMGFGRPCPEAFDPRGAAHMTQGFQPALAGLAHALGTQVIETTASGSYAATAVDVPLADGQVLKAGTLGAQRISLLARCEHLVIEFNTHWFCSRTLEPNWETRDNGWRIQVEGDTPVDVSVAFPQGPQSFADQMSGLTAHPAVNAISFVCSAPAGIIDATSRHIPAPHYNAINA